MYDYAGEWIYRVGIPAKSGVGGGIVAALPSQLGLGTFSPCLDSHGNSVRGLKVCEALSSRFDLHMLNRSADVRTCIIADYDIFGISSRRSRQPHEQQILDERHSDIRVIELVGALNFATIDYVTRRLAGEPPNAPLLILDFRRVPDLTAAGAQLLGENFTLLGNTGVTAILTGLEATSAVWTAIRARMAEPQRLRRFALLDEAIEWAEDQVIYRYGGFTSSKETSHLGEQALLADLAADEIAALAELSTARRYQAGQRIVCAGERANSLFFLQSGMVSVKLPSGVRLASLGPGMEFGEKKLSSFSAAPICCGTFLTLLPHHSLWPRSHRSNSVCVVTTMCAFGATYVPSAPSWPAFSPFFPTMASKRSPSSMPNPSSPLLKVSMWSLGGPKPARAASLRMARICAARSALAASSAFRAASSAFPAS